MADIASFSPEPSALAIIRALLARMASKEGGIRRSLIAGVCLETCGIILGVAGPLALKLLIDAISQEGTSPFMVMVYALGFIGPWAGATLCATWRMVYTTRIIDQVATDLTAAMVRKRLPAAATAREGDSGASLGLVERLPFSLTIVVDGLIWRTVPLCLQLLATLLVLARSMPATYALILGAVVLAYGFVTVRAAATFQRGAAALNTTAGEVSRLSGDIFRNARRVVLNGALEWELSLLRGAYVAKAKANRQMMWALLHASFAQYGVIAVGLSVLLVLSGLDALNHVMTAGAFVLLQTYAFRLILPVSGIGYILSQSSTALGNIREFLSGGDDPAASEAGSGQTLAPAGIVLRDVGFSYGPGMPGLKGIDLDIPAGSFVAIVGPNGSGKSTLAQIMAGLLRPLEGTVLIGGIDMTATPPGDRHRIVLYVPQFIGLFNRSIAENALYPPTGHTEAELLELLAAWQFHEPGRHIDLAAVVGEQGERLSGGQIQKLELARVTGIGAPAIIFDESTSALDPASEEVIVADLRHRFKGRTTMVMITHRKGVARQADQVLFMRSGRLLRRGTHAELLMDSGAYTRLWVNPSE